MDSRSRDQGCYIALQQWIRLLHKVLVQARARCFVFLPRALTRSSGWRALQNTSSWPSSVGSRTEKLGARALRKSPNEVEAPGAGAKARVLRPSRLRRPMTSQPLRTNRPRPTLCCFFSGGLHLPQEGCAPAFGSHNASDLIFRDSTSLTTFGAESAKRLWCR
jgi:hypothetical protein